MDRHEIEQVFHIQYRGFLDYCNFSCSYCPFSKKSYSLKKERMDRDCLFKLFLKLKKEKQPITLEIVPYGEALIYSYYWEFLAKVSQLPQVLAIGCQTNASFSVEKMIAVFLAQGGKLEKLRLWCSFHPTMISTEKFFLKIQELRQYSIKLCVGAVANPLEKQAIVQLFSMLPKDIYFWLNKMDGRKQPYTLEESAFFKTIDPLFFLEEAHFLADSKQCFSKNLFIEANGDYFACNISKIPLGNIYNDKKMLHSYILENQWNKKKCACKECHCFLAYQNRLDLIPELFLFFPYPVFRIIIYYQAAFLNLDNIFREAEEVKKIKKIERIVRILNRMKSYCDIYLITDFSDLFTENQYQKIIANLSGGIFSKETKFSFFSDKKLWEQFKYNCIGLKDKRDIIEFICKKMGYSKKRILIYNF